jgi:DUF917 family protein
MGLGATVPFIQPFLAALDQPECLLTGVGDPGSNLHAPDESVLLDDVRRAALAEALLLGELAGRPAYPGSKGARVPNSDARRIQTADDAHALIHGLTLLSTGGGGLPERGRTYLQALLDEHIAVSWQSLDELHDDALVCTVFGMGSIAPHEPLDAAERARRGFGDERERRPGVRAVRELERLLGQRIDAIIPFELGGFNTSVAVDAAARLERPLVDGDYIGRALPELSQALPAALGFDAHPLAICDNWGNALHLTDCPSAHVAEAIGKMISIVTKTPDMLATCAHACFPMRARDLRTAYVPGTLSRSLLLGRSIRAAQGNGGDALAAAIAGMKGRLLFAGRVDEVDWQSANGYMTGTTRVTGDGDFAGETARVWFKNENHVVWRGDRVCVTSPDLIALVDPADCRPLVNTTLAAGQPVAVLAAPADDRYRSGRPLELTEPRHYGLDLDYVPLDESGGMA